MLSSTESKSKSSKSPLVIVLTVLIFPIFIVIIGIIFSLFIGGNMTEDKLKSQGRVAVEATVIYESEEIEVSNRKFGEESTKHTNYYVMYYIDDKQYFSELKGDQFTISEGSKFIAYYDPSNPQDIIRPIQFSSILYMIVFALIAISFFAIPIIVVIISLKKQKKSQEY